MPADSAFFDTNVFVYAFSDGDPRQDAALRLLLAGGATGVQALNEFVYVSRRKLKVPWDNVLARVGTLRQLCPMVVPVTIDVHNRGLQIAQSTGYHIYDSLMLAAAIESQCTVFYTEDLQPDHKIEGLKIRNPFR